MSLIRHSSVLTASLLIAASALTGCVGTGPNTQQGAVTGGALGAIAGAVIGHNSRGGNELAGAVIGGTVGAIAGGTIGNSVDQQNGTTYDAYGRRIGPPVVIERGPPPAPPLVPESIPASPGSNAVWIAGYWDYNGTGYTWVAGRWEIAPSFAHQYVTAHWETRPGGYAFVRGYWR